LNGVFGTRYCAIRAMHFAQGLIIACAHSESL